jgi:hypothetical protein
VEDVQLALGIKQDASSWVQTDETHLSESDSRVFGCWKVVLQLTEAFTSIVVFFLGGFAKDLIDIIIFRLLLLYTFFLNKILCCFYLHRARLSFSCFLIFLHKTIPTVKSEGEKLAKALIRDAQTEDQLPGFPWAVGQGCTHARNWA